MIWNGKESVAIGGAATAVTGAFTFIFNQVASGAC
jgi:hypothetical protein